MMIMFTFFTPPPHTHTRLYILSFILEYTPCIRCFCWLQSFYISLRKLYKIESIIRRINRRRNGLMYSIATKRVFAWWKAHAWNELQKTTQFKLCNILCLHSFKIIWLKCSLFVLTAGKREVAREKKVCFFRKKRKASHAKWKYLI